MAKKIITRFPEFLDMQDADGNTPLHWMVSLKESTDIQSFITPNNLKKWNKKNKNTLRLAFAR